jgi:glyoxylase-like metal-dependent hydrolase (beta-lactamase superfamily II)
VWPGELDHLRRHGHWDAGTATADLLRNDASTLTPPPGWRPWDGITEPVTDGHQIRLGPLTATLLHTPGHTPGGLTVAIGSHLLTGDTLFPGGPGLTGTRWPTSDFDTIMHSVDRLMTWPDDTTVHPGHGSDTIIGAERPRVPSWRGPRLVTQGPPVRRGGHRDRARMDGPVWGWPGSGGGTPGYTTCSAAPTWSPPSSWPIRYERSSGIRTHASPRVGHAIARPFLVAQRPASNSDSVGAQ